MKEQKQMTKTQRAVQEFKGLAVMVFFVFLFRSMFFEPFKIPSGSMVPSLMIGDFILVNKLAYGVKVPFTEWLVDIVLDSPIYLQKFIQPKRGDVVVFVFPKDTSMYFIKRLIGIPGDVVEIVDKKVFINGKEVETRPVEGQAIMDDMDDKFKNEKFLFYEGNIEGKKFTYQVIDDSQNSEPTKFVVPPNEYFVMGDNRDHSYDSRFWGTVPQRYIKGKAILVWWSMIFPWNEYPAKFRPHRIGRKIE